MNLCRTQSLSPNSDNYRVIEDFMDLPNFPNGNLKPL